MEFKGNKMLTESFELSKNAIHSIFSSLIVLAHIPNHTINKGTISSWILKYIYSSKVLGMPGISLSFAPIIRKNKIMKIRLSTSSASESFNDNKILC